MKQIRESKFSKIIAYYLMITLIIEVIAPTTTYALTSGPSQPEFNAFTPIGTSDMVDLASGDFNYNIPVMDVGGYPINLAYNSGITMDQEASWVGLGWNLNVGEISRQVRGLPDDFKGDKLINENNQKDNVTIGTNFNISPALLGNDTPFNLGLGVQYNNYSGVSFQPSVGISYSLFGCAQVGATLTGSATDGATISPSISLSRSIDDNSKASIGLSAGFNSRKGFENVSMSASTSNYEKNKKPYAAGRDHAGEIGSHQSGGGSIGIGSLSFNNQSYTPSKRVAFDNNNKTFNATIGGEVFGVEGQVRISGYGSYQKVNSDYLRKVTPAYGYEYSQYKNGNEGVLDFNREKEQTVNSNTNVLPVTNYTYDIYNIEGQGISGMFRPFRSQVTSVYNDNVSDFSTSGDFGGELGLGNLVHGGFDFKNATTISSTGAWNVNNFARPSFLESNTDNNNPLYQQTNFKMVGEMDVDYENVVSGYLNKLHLNKAMRLKIDGSKYSRVLLPSYSVKQGFGPNYTTNPITSKIKRKGRLLRNQSIQKVLKSEADNDKFIFKNDNAAPHHVAGMKILQNDGTTYVYGRSVYNKTKVEATFDVGNNNEDTNGLVSYNGNVRDNWSSTSDRFVNKITTPSYAHSYLITSILSSDYQDIDNNGPTDSDLGNYTKFDYWSKTDEPNSNYVKDYQWRTPYAANKASYNPGLKTSARDNKGNYIYGVKELVYLKKIETKTHVAFIDLINRNDAMGVNGENGGQGTTAMKAIKSIRLYSKSELQLDADRNVIDPGISSNIKPIKTAHFEYDYSLCKGIPSSLNAGGKLTLKKLYFTYRGSNMGKFTPYKFNYSETFTKKINDTQSEEVPYNYNIKGFDVWGNFKENNNPTLSTSDFPFVNQNNQELADKYTSAWTLNSIELPSGGKISIQTESDDYKYVQNRKAMQMFMAVGTGNSSSPDLANLNKNQLYDGWGTPSRYIYVKIKENEVDESLETANFTRKYLSQQLGKSIYFKFMLNMTNEYMDYVSGYFEIENMPVNVFNRGGKAYAAIPLKFLRTDGSGSQLANPISKTGWGFGRTYLNKAVYGGSDRPNDDFESIVQDLVGSIGSMINVFKGPNKVLKGRRCAQKFNTNQSWIRLENPDGKKLGGGLRVKKIELSDNWDVMNSVEGNAIYEDIFEESYGQEYNYKLNDGTSSGVATFEPNGSYENPFVEPFYGKDGNYAERIAAPRELNFTELPFGETFFPSPRITYSKITVSNLNKKQAADANKVIKKHATGKVVTEHYTSFDFPTKTDLTDLYIQPDPPNKLSSFLLKVKSTSHITASQGFTIETNDMNGKVKSQSVYPEGQDAPISKVVNKYNVDSKNQLTNEFTTINSEGKVKSESMGVTYDVINDFNESKTITNSYGVNTNLATFLVGFFPIPVPMPLPTLAKHEGILRTATTTKVIHRTGVLVEKVAYDLGSRVSTKNLAWDANTGQVLLTETINEFDDKYYSFNYPAYWFYESMGMASQNVDLKGKLLANNGLFSIDGYTLSSTEDISKYFKIADELILGNGEKFWVSGYNTAKTKIQLINRDGVLVDNSNAPSDLSFKVVRSGNKNQQMISMASVTSMVNPIDTNGDNVLENLTANSFKYDLSGAANDSKVVNASAIEYSQIWESQCENRLPNDQRLIDGQGAPVNPYLYNILGNWRPNRSHAYLAGRNNFITSHRRKSGYYANFSPFYQLTGGKWTINNNKWTFASEVTKFSPYGVELENKDALDRYSSAQYGYQYKLPMAVTSNSRYQQMGFDGFEDYTIESMNATMQPHFGFSQGLPANEGAFLSSEKSHTGHNSLAIKPGQKMVFKRKIGGCKSDSIAPRKNLLKKQ